MKTGGPLDERKAYILATVVYEYIATAEPVAADGTLIGQTVTIRGRLSSRENIVVEGEIEGDIEIPAHRVTIGMAGRMRGDVLAAEVVNVVTWPRRQLVRRAGRPRGS